MTFGNIYRKPIHLSKSLNTCVFKNCFSSRILISYFNYSFKIIAKLIKLLRVLQKFPIKIVNRNEFRTRAFKVFFTESKIIFLHWFRWKVEDLGCRVKWIETRVYSQSAFINAMHNAHLDWSKHKCQGLIL